MSESKYQQIVQHLKDAIESGTLATGNKIPSIRRLSHEFNCSKDTAQRALAELRYQQYIYAKPKSGYYVLEQEQDHEDMEIQLSHDRYPAYEDFRLCVNETLIGRENYLFNYYSQQEGLEDLRRSVQNLLADQSIYAKFEEIVLTSGTQQALYILSQIDFPNQKSQILVEQPTYHRMNLLLHSQELAYRTINRGVDGIDLEELETIFKTGRIKFFYTIPRFHYPLGHSYSRQEKLDILRLAHLYDVYIVEDDYLGDLDSKRELTFHYLDDQQHVVYIKSFSTSLFPALRITALLLPTTIQQPFVHYKSLMDYDSNLIMQKALSLYIDNGMFERNRLNLLKQQQERQADMLATVQKNNVTQPFYLLPNALLLQLDEHINLPALKHSGLDLDFFESAYLGTCPYQYVSIKAKHLESCLRQMGLYQTK